MCKHENYLKCKVEKKNFIFKVKKRKLSNLKIEQLKFKMMKLTRLP